jgi:hypothetical protein
LFRPKLVGQVVASVVLLPPHKHILEASKTNVCSLMNTFAFQFAIDIDEAIQQLLELDCPNNFRTVQKGTANSLS